MSDLVGPARRDSQASRIARVLLDRIASGVYAVGSKIPSERALSAELGVSRPVVREALSTVSAMNILDVQMGRGAFVIAAPADHVVQGGMKLQDVINVREILEVGALELSPLPSGNSVEKVSVALVRLRQAVVERHDTVEADRALHSAIVESASSPLLLSLWASIDQQIEETIRISPHGRTMSPDILHLHERLAAGITSKSTADAIEASALLHQQNREFLRGLLC